MAKKTLVDRIGELWGAYEAREPDWDSKAAKRLIRGAFESLRKYTEDPNEPEITWPDPFVELRYPVRFNVETNNPEFWEVLLRDADEFTEEEAKELVAAGFLDFQSVEVLFRWTHGVVNIQLDDNNRETRFPPALARKMENLTDEQKAKYIDGLWEPTIIKAAVPEYEDLKISLVWQVMPLEVDLRRSGKDRAYFPIFTSLFVRGGRAATWTQKDREIFWEKVIGAFRETDGRPGPGLALPEPKAKPNSPYGEKIRAGMHVEGLQFGAISHEGLFDKLFDRLPETQKERLAELQAKGEGPHIIGFDLSISQKRAYFAVQKLLSATNYQGNLPKTPSDPYADEFKYRGDRIGLDLTVSEYLDAYNVQKFETSRGKLEYSGEERSQALQALRSLAKQPFILWYTRREYHDDRKPTDTLVQEIAPLVAIRLEYPELQEGEGKSLLEDSLTAGGQERADKRLGRLVIFPSVALYDQVDSHYLLKNASYLDEIQRAAPKAPRAVYNFVDWLQYQAEYLRREDSRNWTKTISLEALARIVRLEAYIKGKRAGLIQKTLEKCFKIAGELGYTLGVEFDKGRNMYTIRLNPEKFARL